MTYLAHLKALLIGLEGRSGSPKGCEIVAGGRRPPETEQMIYRHPEGVPDSPLERVVAPLQGGSVKDFV
jgi:hypothetical protein